MTASTVAYKLTISKCVNTKFRNALFSDMCLYLVVYVSLDKKTHNLYKSIFLSNQYISVAMCICNRFYKVYWYFNNCHLDFKDINLWLTVPKEAHSVN